MIKVERNLENAPELVEAVQSSDDAAAAQTEGVVTTLEADVVDTLLIKLRIHQDGCRRNRIIIVRQPWIKNIQHSE